MTFTNTTNLTSALDILAYGHTNTQGWFGTLILIMIFTVCFMSMKSKFTTSRCLAGSMFLTTIIAVILSVLELLDAFPFLVTVVLLICSVIYVRIDQD